MTDTRVKSVAATVLLAALLWGCNSPTDSEPGALAGTYQLSEWLYVFWGDTIRLTDDSFLRLHFHGQEHVEGEALLWLLVPTNGGEEEFQRQAILGALDEDGDIVPLPLRGWYYLTQVADESDVLRFSFRRPHGAGSWVEGFDWILSEDGDSYVSGFTTTAEELQVSISRN